MGFSCRRGGGATSRGTRPGQRKRPAAALTPASPTAPSGVTARAIPAAVRRHSSGFLTDMKGSRPICLPARVAPTGTLPTALAVEPSRGEQGQRNLPENETGRIAFQNGPYCTTKQAVPQCNTTRFTQPGRPGQNPTQAIR